MLVKLGVEFDVKAFVYSSSLQPAPDYDENVQFSRLSKRKIEGYCKAAGEEEGLNWT